MRTNIPNDIMCEYKGLSSLEMLVFVVPIIFATCACVKPESIRWFRISSHNRLFTRSMESRAFLTVPAFSLRPTVVPSCPCRTQQ
jgi:hypothetical protein